MKRRGFLKAFLGLFAAPVVANLPALDWTEVAVDAVNVKAVAHINPLFTDEVGFYEGLQWTESERRQAVSVFSAHLSRELSLKRPRAMDSGLIQIVEG